ncbi:bifunctional [glutamate--ammonia ligase]-adenylyl-L-tyrosine phosphorylase/[glutamate--ammonia-ligase] adenylyltransferase [Rehaibacterium terrae]|uniref:Bifunctional glutamine synthetase adenylyltransferase/adenylyl-removing enzyme n=1 Tax=Rehaibacterium terrae TaxID=1341696 RepID=A0A7W8DED4_9GAMM|nr:bifunctional [glutamate--ammonia ligase]-adenylyl-L-tyrosine phosphorylase/[glutamate--ammonia-ligase] adenylyltransferase [Rehaibacterium terrae]MBB5015424.1 glutamate-ammonia-ligase adenylyltransferase [Rehaibacterium terrae]
MPTPTLPPALADFLAPRLERLAEADPGLAAAIADPARRPGIERLLLASDFAFDALQRMPDWLDGIEADIAPPRLAAEDEPQWPARLRRYRRRQSLRLVWRDVNGLDDVEATLAGSSRLAEACLDTALTALETQFVQRHGWVRDAAGTAQRLVVFGLGKLGGGELNFSSDIDLVFAYPEGGQSDGARPLDAETWFARFGQRLIQLLDEVTAEGFCHRVDMRLRPFGASGRLALSFSAMEQYFQREGRDWERYAWIKARPVAGDRAAGEALLDTLRPFVYRRYLDYTALDGLREMKALIAAEVARRELAEHVKLGPGGIREIEFLAQALQLIRGGREPELRQRNLLRALAALVQAGHLDDATGERLAVAYRFLRRLENRLQMLADQQVHTLPDDPLTRARLSVTLGFADWEALYAELAAHRTAVSEEFDRLLAPRRRAAQTSALATYWRALPDGGEPGVLGESGFGDVAGIDAVLRDFARSPALRALSARGRARLDHVLPALLAAAAQSHAPDAAVPRLLGLLHAIARRTSYLALLEEQPAALQRLVDVTARSALLAERLEQHPLLLDELLDVRAAGPVPDRASLTEELARALARADAEDAESVLLALNEFRQGASFRIALATLSGRQPARDAVRQLAWLAELIVGAALAQVERELAAQHGRVPDAGIAVLGYGSFGGEELNFGSDLDLVFLYDAAPDALSDGARPLEAARWYAKLAQKLVSFLGTVSPAGRLYEVDVRLRPDGAKGLLVSTVASFAAYQRERAWTWERQALVRARAVAGGERVVAAFEQVRTQSLCAQRDPQALREDVVAMRRRMRAELDRSDAARFDLKQGEGGLVDLEFLLQAGVLEHAVAHPALAVPRATPALIEALRDAGVLTRDRAEALHAARDVLLARALGCTLDRRPRLVGEDAELAQARAAIRAACLAHGLDFRTQARR